MPTNRPFRLAVLIPNVWGIRNVVHSGVLRKLTEQGVETYLLIRRLPQDSQKIDEDYRYTKELHALLVPPTTNRILGKAFLDGLIHSSFMQRNHIRSYPIYSRWFQRHESSRQRIRSRLVWTLGYLMRFSQLNYQLYDLSERLYRRSVDLNPVRDHLIQISPDLVWSTAYITYHEHAYVSAADDLNIPVLASVLSFDNLTSRTSYLHHFSHYTVWSEWMKRQLVRFYPHVLSEHVTVTGTPQFDFHQRKESCLTRKETLSLFGLASSDRYFVYGASTQNLAPDEPRLVRQLAQQMSLDQELMHYKIVVRLHPFDDGSRWQAELSQLENVSLSAAWNEEPDSDGWAFITSAEQIKMVSLLTHAEACINIASTIGLDAAILNRPVIGIDFRYESNAPQEILYEEYYTEHYSPLIHHGAVAIAYKWDELMTLMKEAITCPEKHKNGRQLAVHEVCGMVDGHSASRLVLAVLKQLTETR